MDKEKLIADLSNPDGGEGFRGLAYDDATGHAIAAGSHLIGNPTIGIGWNTAARPISLTRAQIILGWQLTDEWAGLLAKMPWVENLSDGRQRAVTELSFNLGEGKLEQFDTFLKLMRIGDYEVAADDLASTQWAKQVSSERVKRILLQIRMG